VGQELMGELSVDLVPVVCHACAAPPPEVPFSASAGRVLKQRNKYNYTACKSILHAFPGTKMLDIYFEWM